MGQNPQRTPVLCIEFMGHFSVGCLVAPKWIIPQSIASWQAKVVPKAKWDVPSPGFRGLALAMWSGRGGLFWSHNAGLNLDSAKSCLCYVPWAGWSQTNELTFLCLSSLPCEMVIIIPSSWGWNKGRSSAWRDVRHRISIQQLTDIMY